MRKLFAILLAAALALLLFGCNSQPTPTEPVTSPTVVTQPPTEPLETEPDITQPEETEPLLDSAILYGIDISGMTADEAKAAITDAIANYTLTLTVNNHAIKIPNETLSITMSDETFDSWFQQTAEGNEPSVAGLISFDSDAALSLVRDELETTAKNASIAFNSRSRQFEIQNHRNGTSANLSTVESALINAVSSLSPTANASATLSSVPASVLATDSRLPGAVAAANSYLNLNISYTYEASGITTTTQSLSKTDISKFISIDKSFNVGLNSQAIRRYVNQMSSQFGSIKKDFRTTHGNTVNLTVEYYTAVLDQDAMYQDLYNCLKNKNSGNRTAVFSSSTLSSMPYGGNYVEIDLSSQYLWLYRNGKLVISTHLVSGCVAERRRTPSGVYSIFGKYTDTYLSGPTWYSHVDYWMPFNGGIGLHDASWRDEFGGSIYMYDGSHGCVNLPPQAAGVIYKNVSLGTKVILYGGLRSVGKLEQVLSGTESYNLTPDTAPFSMDVTPKYNGVTFRYSSSNTKVVTVDKKGVVTVVGPGTADITVTTDAINVLSKGKLVVHITVEEPVVPDETEPEETTPEETEPEETLPEVTEPEETAPEETVPEETVPEETVPEETAPEETVPEETSPEATEPLAPSPEEANVSKKEELINSRQADICHLL